MGLGARKEREIETSEAYKSCSEAKNKKFE